MQKRPSASFDGLYGHLTRLHSTRILTYMAAVNNLPRGHASTRTIQKTFRISHTQDQLLKQRFQIGDSAKGKSSALVRVLLNLYFNKRLAALKFQGIDVEKLLEDEIKNAQQAIVENGNKFRNMLKAQSARKKAGGF